MGKGSNPFQPFIKTFIYSSVFMHLKKICSFLFLTLLNNLFIHSLLFNISVICSSLSSLIHQNICSLVHSFWLRFLFALLPTCSLQDIHSFNHPSLNVHPSIHRQPLLLRTGSRHHHWMFLLLFIHSSNSAVIVTFCVCCCVKLLPDLLIDSVACYSHSVFHGNVHSYTYSLI